MRLLLIALLFACASAPRTARLYRAPPWHDLDKSLAAIRCAVEMVDGIDMANAVMAPKIVAVDNYHLRACYDPDTDMDSGCRPDRPPPTIYLSTDVETAWHSPLRYELLCRRMTHLKEGDPRLCDSQRWEQELEPLYTPALRECWFKVDPDEDSTGISNKELIP